MQNQHPALSLLAKPFDRPPLPSFAIWLLSVPSLPMAVLYRDATLWEPRVVQIPLFVIVRLYTPIGKIILTVQILYNYTVPEILYEIFGFRVVQFPLFVIVRLYTPIGNSSQNKSFIITLWEPRVVQIPLFVIVRLYTPIGKSQYNFLIITEAL